MRVHGGIVAVGTAACLLIGVGCTQTPEQVSHPAATGPGSAPGATGLTAAIGSGTTTNTTPGTTTGTPAARFTFAGSPSATDRRATVSILNARFEALALPARAQEVDGRVEVLSSGGAELDERVVTSVTRRGELSFRPVASFLPPGTDAAAPVGQDPTVWPGAANTGVTGLRYLLGPAAATGDALDTVAARLDRTVGAWVVHLGFKPGVDGIDRFNRLARACYDKTVECPTGQVAITLDREVISVVGVKQPTFAADQIQLGGFDEAAAEALAVTLRFGPLPAQVEPAR